MQDIEDYRENSCLIALQASSDLFTLLAESLQPSVILSPSTPIVLK